MPAKPGGAGDVFGMTFAAAGLRATIGFTLPVACLPLRAIPSPECPIQVYNYSQASPALLTRAEREAGRILGKAARFHPVSFRFCLSGGHDHPERTV